MRQVQPSPGQFRQGDITRYHHIFCRGRHPGEPQLGRDGPFVHTAPLGEMQIFAMIDHRHVKGQCILHRSSHDQAIHHRLPIIRDRDTAGTTQVSELRQFLPFRAFCNRADRKHIRQPSYPRTIEHEFCNRLIVIDGIRIGHTTDRGEAAGHRRSRSALDRLFVFEARLPEMDMEIDEAGKDQSSRGVNFRGPRGNFEVMAYRDDSALIDQHIGHAIEPSRIDHVPAYYVNSHDSVCS